MPLSAKLLICGARTAGLQHIRPEIFLRLGHLGGKNKTLERTFYHCYPTPVWSYLLPLLCKDAIKGANLQQSICKYFSIDIDGMNISPSGAIMSRVFLSQPATVFLLYSVFPTFGGRKCSSWITCNLKVGLYVSCCPLSSPRAHRPIGTKCRLPPFSPYGKN